MTVLPRDHAGLVDLPPATRGSGAMGLLLALARGLGAVVLPPLAFLASAMLCVAALVLADASMALRVALVLVAAVPATGSILVSRSLLGAPPFSFWVALGALPSLAGGWLLVAVV